MNKKLKKYKHISLNLSMQFLLVLVMAGLLGTAAAFLSIRLTGSIIRAKMENPEYVEQNIQNKVNEFQEYVTENSLSSRDTEQISDWVRRQRNVMLAISNGDNIIYDSTDFRLRGPAAGGKPVLPAAYSVRFSDIDADVQLFELLEFKYVVISNYFSILLGIIVFLIIVIVFIQKKVSYITTLEKEVNILESGDLDYKLTLKGNDELTYLAKSIDDMRLSIIDRQKEEIQNQLAKRKLVTAMSHDLRTPLTVLIGLLEIIDGKKYNGEEELFKYISKAKNKSYRIKELSDDIFEYFFAFGITENEMDKQEYKINTIHTMIDEHIFGLSEKGFSFENVFCTEEAQLMLDIKLFSRVIDNLFSNLLKYADKADKIKVCTAIENNTLNITFTNSKKTDDFKEESTNIGVEVCKNIVERHNGQFVITEDKAVYTTEIKLPCL